MKVGKFEIIKCQECELIRLKHQLSLGEIKQQYSLDYYFSNNKEVGYGNYEHEEAALRKNFDRRVQEITNLGVQKRKMLDIGCGLGYFVSEARKKGWDAWGLEIDPGTVKYAQQRFGSYFLRGTMENLNPSKKYDVITAWDVLEHTPQPDKFVEKAAKLLRPGGLLGLSTGDISSIVAKLSKQKWHLYNLPEHLFFYTPPTIHKLLHNYGFEVIKINYPTNYYSLGYLIERLSKKTIKTSFNWLLPVNLGDIMEVFARKVA